MAETAWPRFDQIVDLLAVELHMRAVLRVIGEEERRAHVAFVCLAARIFAEGVVEAAEVGKVGNVGDQALHAGVKRRLLLAITREPALQFARDIRENLDQVGDVTAGVVDVGLEQDAVARGLVELDVELTCQQSLELGAIKPGGTAQQSDAGGIQNELVGRPGVIDGLPAHTVRMEVFESAGTILGGHHLGVGRDA